MKLVSFWKRVIENVRKRRQCRWKKTVGMLGGGGKGRGGFTDWQHRGDTHLQLTANKVFFFVFLHWTTTGITLSCIGKPIKSFAASKVLRVEERNVSSFWGKKRISHFYTLRQIAHTTTTDKTAKKQLTPLDHTKKSQTVIKVLPQPFADK